VVDILDAKTDKQIRLTLRSGEYELELKGAPEGLKLDIKNAKLTRGETVLATITRDNPRIATTEPPPAKKPPEGVVAWWRADGDGKASVGDNHGELKGGVTFDPGIAGKAFRLDGATRYVEVTRSDRWGFGKRDFSIELWVQFRALTPSRDIGHPAAIFIGCDEGNDEGNRPRNKWFFAYGGGFLNFHINQPNGESGFFAKANFSPDVDQWYHLAVTRSQGTFIFYVNGAPVASEKVDITIPNPDAPLTIGQAENIGFFSGLMDEVVIYDRALSPDEVKTRWSALAPATKPVNEKVGEVRRFLGHTADVNCVACSPDGRYAVSCSGWPTWDLTIRVWDVSTGKQVRKFDSLEGKVQCAAFSPDGRRILYGSDHTAFLLDADTGKEVQRFVGHGKIGIGAVTFSPNGRQVLSAGNDGTARVWDADTGKELCKFEGHGERVMQAVFSPDGKRALGQMLIVSACVPRCRWGTADDTRCRVELIRCSAEGMDGRSTGSCLPGAARPRAVAPQMGLSPLL
jgi:hypothetical protein